LRRTSDGTATEAVSSATLDLEPAEIADIERYLDVSRGEILFAKGVLLVEGDAEEYLIPILAALNDFQMDELGISVCSVAGTHFSPYLKFLGPSGLNIPCAIITDMDPSGDDESDGIPRVRRLLEFLDSDALSEITDDSDLEALAKTHGIFLTAHTLEVALFACGRHKTFSNTMNELSLNGAAKSRADEWKTAPKSLEVAKMLKDIESIGKGRFAQRWAEHISRSKSKVCPQSILEALGYVAARISPSSASVPDSSEGATEEP